MSGRYSNPRSSNPRFSSGRGWDRGPRTPSWVYALVGLLLTLAVVLVVLVVTNLGGDDGGLASATSTPTVAPTSSAASATGGPGTAAPTNAATPVPTDAVTPAPTAPAASPLPSGSIKPTLVSITLPHRADCNGENGTGQVGMIRINWSVIGAPGVRISIDPPATDATAYDYGFADYATATGPQLVPFACGATLHDGGGPYHLYVVTTLHTSGYFQWRYQKVYQFPAPTP